MPENYRVYKVPKALRQATKADRLNREERLADYLDDAVAQQLDQIVDGLNTLGIKAQVKTGACRWPVSDMLLMKLRKASDKTGIAASYLLIACLELHTTQKKAKPKAKRTKKKATARKRRATA
jgi:hypothetical protein